MRRCCRRRRWGPGTASRPSWRSAPPSGAPCGSYRPSIASFPAAARLSNEFLAKMGPVCVCCVCVCVCVSHQLLCLCCVLSTFLVVRSVFVCRDICLFPAGFSYLATAALCLSRRCDEQAKFTFSFFPSMMMMSAPRAVAFLRCCAFFLQVLS